MKPIKSIYLIIIINLLFISTSHSQTKSPKLKVYYFHATMRCESCLAAENVTKNVLDKYFKKELDNGTIEFASYNLEEDKNKALVDKYKIMFSTLLLIESDGTVTDFTDKAFELALDKPEEYTELLKPEIYKILK